MWAMRAACAGMFGCCCCCGWLPNKLDPGAGALPNKLDPGAGALPNKLDPGAGALPNKPPPEGAGALPNKPPGDGAGAENKEPPGEGAGVDPNPLPPPNRELPLDGAGELLPKIPNGAGDGAVPKLKVEGLGLKDGAGGAPPVLLLAGTACTVLAPHVTIV